jgi:peptidoglycan hydrolase-like protein with peptidoglycan-binding domain
MAYEQVQPFNPKKMGKLKGYCLQNVAKGFGAYPSANPSQSAKDDMNINISKGTFHKGMGDIPTNCAVIVYIKTTSKYGHCEAYDKTTFYNDGKATKNPGTVLGWGEICNGFRLVRKTAQKTFLPAKGYWGKGDKDQRIADLALFMRQNFPSYTSAKALGPEFGPYLEKAIKEFQKRADVKPKLISDGYVGPKTYDALKKYGFVY